MNDQHAIRLTMFNTVRNFILAHGTELSSLPNFMDLSEQFNSIIDQIEEFGQELEAGRSGVSIAKSGLKNALVTASYDMSRRLVAYALLTDNDTLKGEVDFNLSELNLSTDTILKHRCGVISQRAKTNLSDLATYQVTEDLIGELDAKIADFVMAINKPKAARTNHKLATEKLKALLNEGDALLKGKIDALIDMLRIQNYDLYNAYRKARALNKDYGSRKLAVIVNVTDKSGAPISKVEARFEGNNKPRKTTEKGKFQIDILPTGTYIFNFSREGYKPVSARVIVIEGETTKVNVVMEAIPEYVSEAV